MTPVGTFRDNTRADPVGAPAPPTRTANYAALNALFVALAAVSAVTGHKQWRDGQPISQAELPSVGLAVFALSKLIAREKVGTWIREPFVEESADHKPKHPTGTGMQYAVGELLTCTRCVGAWSALGLVGLRTVSPGTGRYATTLLAAIASNDLLHAGFKALCARS